MGVDCTVEVGTAGMTLAVATSPVVFSGVWEPGAGTDDGYSYNVSAFNTTSQYFYIGGYATKYEAFIRFPSLEIPRGATIRSAVWRGRLYTRYAGDDPAVVLHCQLADDAVAPSTGAQFNALSLTTGTSWGAVPDAALRAWIEGPDFAPEVQAVIDRAGWSPGNAVMVVIKNATDSGDARRAFYSYEQGDGYRPQLVVSWTTPATGEVTADVSTATLALAVHPAGATADVTSQASCPGLTLAVPPASVTCDVAAGVNAVSLALAVLAGAARGDVAADVSAPGLALAVLPATVDIPSGTVADVGTASLSLAILPAAATADALAETGMLALALSVLPAEAAAVNHGDCQADVATAFLVVAVKAARAELVHIREWLTLQSPATLTRTLSGPASLAAAFDSPANLTKRLRSPVDLAAR